MNITIDSIKSLKDGKTDKIVQQKITGTKKSTGVTSATPSFQTVNIPQPQSARQQLMAQQDVQSPFSGQLTASNVLARIMTIGQTDRASGEALFKDFMTFTQDPSNPLYNPYMSATNKAVSEIQKLGISVPASGITSQWLEQNRGLLNNARYTTTGDSPAAPTTKSTREQNAAYWYYQILKDEERTQKAEQEWKALQEEISYWVNRYDRSYSDQEILDRIDWSNYKTLAAMDDTINQPGLTPVSLNRSIGYSRDNLYGAIWAARNNTTTGNAYTDSVSYRLGRGDSYYANDYVINRRTADSGMYNPYAVGSSPELDDAALYFGEVYFDKDWLDRNRAMISSNDSTMRKMYNKVYEAEQITVAAETELEQLHKDIDYWMETIHNPDDIIDILYSSNDYKTLKKMDASLETSSDHLLPTTRAIDYSRKDIEAMIRDRCKEFSDQKQDNVFAQDVADTLGITPATNDQDDAINQEKNDQVQKTAPYIAKNGTEAEKDIYKYAYTYNWDNYMNTFGTAIYDGTLPPQEAYDKHISYTNEYACKYYFDANQTVRQYEAAQNNQAALAEEVDRLQKAYDEALKKRGGKDPTDYTGMTPDEVRMNLLITYKPDPEEGEIAAARTALQDAQNRQRDNDKYLQTNAKKYEDAQKQLKKIEDSYDFAARIANLAGVEQTEEEVWETRSMLDLIGNYAQAPEAPQINSYSVYDFALSQGQSQEDVVKLATDSSLQYIAGIEAVDQILDWIKRNDVKIDDVYLRNLEAQKAIYEDQVKDTAYFMLREQDDFNNVVSAFKQEMSDYWNGLDWIKKSFGEKAYADHALAIIDPTLAGADMDSMVELSGNAGRRGNILAFTPEEQNTYLYIYAKEGKEAAEQYFDYLQDRVNARMGEQANQVIMDMFGGKVDSGSEAFLGTLGTVLASPLRLIGSLYSIKQLATGEEINPRHWAYSWGNTMDQIRNESKEHLESGVEDEGLKALIDFGYDAITSAADSGYSAFLGKAIGLTSIFNDKSFAGMKQNTKFTKWLADWLPKGLNSFMGASLQGSYAIGSTAQELSLRGVKDAKDIALITGVNFLCESLTEAIEVSDILGIDDADTFKSLWKGGHRIKAALKGLQADDALGEALSTLIEALPEQYLDEEIRKYDLNTEDGCRLLLNDVLYSAAMGMVSAEISHIATAPLRRKGKGQNQTQQNQNTPQNPPNGPTNSIDTDENANVDADLSDMMPEDQQETGLALTAPSKPQPTIDFDYGMKVKTENGEKTLIGLMDHDGSEVRYLTEDGEIVSQKEITGMEDADLQEVNRILAQESVTETLQEAHDILESNKAEYNSLLGQRAPEPQGPMLPGQEQIESDRRMIALRQQTLLQMAQETNDPASRTAAIASVLAGGNTDVMHNQLVTAAAINFMKQHGDIQKLSEIWLSSTEAGIDNDLFRTAMAIAMSTDGDANRYLERMMGRDYTRFSKEEINGLIRRSMMDVENPDLLDRLRARVNELSTAQEEKRLIGDGALSGTESAKQAMDNANANAAQAAEQAEAAERTAQEAAENVKVTTQQMLDNPSDGNLVGASKQAIKDAEGKRIVADQMQQSKDNADEQAKNATEAYNSTYDAAMKDVREQAAANNQAAVEAEQQAREEQSEQEALQAQEDARKNAKKGHTGQVTDSEGNTQRFHYEVVDARAIEMGEIDEEGQKTVAEIAGGIKPQKMMQGATPEEGAPLLNPDYTVVDGNKRLAGIQQAKSEGHGLRYTGWLKMNASQYGFTPSDVNSNTVLVRVLDGPVQEQSQPSAPVTPVTPVTQEAPATPEATETQTAPETPAEQPAPAPQTETEQPKPKKKAAAKTKAQPTQMASQDQAKNIAQAEADSGKLSKKILGLFTRFSDSGKVGSKGNVKFVKGFLSLVDPSERAGLLEKDPVTGKTHLNDEGERRMISALFHRAYGKANTDNTKNMSKRYANSSVAMAKMAPAVALLNANTEDGEVYNYDLGKKLSDAAAIIKNLGNLTVEEYLEQPDLSTDDGNSTIDPVTAELARMLYRNGNHADRLVKDIQSIVDAIYEQGKPEDGKTAPDAVELIQNALGLDLDEDKTKGKKDKKSKAVIGGGNGGTAGGQGSTANGPVRNSPYRIAKNLAHAIGVGEYFDQLVDRHIRQNERDTQGYYQARIDYVTSRPTAAGNVHEPFHELGHAIAARIGLTGTPQMVNTLRQMAANGQTNLNVNAYTNAQLADEAFAEFFYRYISDPQLARQFAGDVFTDQFEQMLRSNDLYDAVHEAGTEVQLFLNADVNRQIGAVIKDRSEVERKPIFQRLRGLIPKIVDASSAAEQINQEIRQQTGGQGPEMSADVRARALQRNFAARRVDYILTQNLTDPDGNVVGESLAGALAPLNGKDDFDLYIRYGLAKHAVDRHDNGRLVLSEDIWGADGRSVQDFIDDVERNHHNIAEAFENFQAWRNDFLKTWMVDTGFMTQETLDRLNQMYPNYVPTFRVNGKGFTGRIQHTTGSTQDIINTMDSWIDMVSQIVEMNMKNRVAVAFHNAYSTYENMGQFGAMIEGFGENEPLMTSDEIIDGLTNGTLGRTNINGLSQTNRTNTSDTICAVLPDGRRVYYQVNDKPLHDLLAGTGSKVDDTYNMASKSVGILTRAMSKLTTGSNPLFAVSNALRDFQNSVNYGSWASNYLTGIVRWFRAMGEVIGNSAKFQEYTAQGGGGWTRIDTANEGATNDIRNRLVPGYHNESLAHRAWNILTLDRVNEIVEQTSRFAEYRFGQNDTDTLEGRQRAFLAAQEATTDFARQGNTKLLNTLGQIIPFLKASTQGVYRFGRMFTEAERGRLAPRLAKTVFNTALTSALLNGLLLKFGSDDEKEDFINMSDDYKTGFFTLPNFAPDILGNRDLIRIPLAQDPIISAVHSYMTNAMWKGSTDQFAIDAMSIAEAVIDNVNPFNNPVWSAFNDIQMNRNWYGSKIVPTRLEGLDSSDRYTETTPDAFIGLSRGLNAGLDTLGGLGANVDTAKDMVSPLNLQYIAQQYTGFLGQMVLPSISKDKHTGNMVGIMGAVNAARNRFTVDPTVSSKLTSSFYDNKTWLEQITKTASAGKPLNVLRRGLSQDEVNQAVADAKAMTSKGGVIKTTLDTINGLYDEIDDIMANDTISDADKNTLIKEKRRAINAACLEANEAVQEYREKYVTGRSLATSALYEGALADPASAKTQKKSNADTLPQTFRDDADKDYMQKAQAVYQATGKNSALPHPSYSFKSEGHEYTVDEASREGYDAEYKKWYLKYLNDNKVLVKWDSMDDEQRLSKMQGAHNSAISKAKQWYLKTHR